MLETHGMLITMANGSKLVDQLTSLWVWVTDMLEVHRMLITMAKGSKSADQLTRLWVESDDSKSSGEYSDSEYRMLTDY